jgi:hypothetical protein
MGAARTSVISQGVDTTAGQAPPSTQEQLAHTGVSDEDQNDLVISVSITSCREDFAGVIT